MGKDTKQRLLQQGLASFMTKGFNHTGIQEVLEAVDVPKGSFYHYFKSKEDFGKQVLHFYSGQMLEWTKAAFDHPELPPLLRFRQFFDQARAKFDQAGYSGGCLVGNMSQEMGDLSQEFECLLEAKMAALAGIFADQIREAQARGEMSPDRDPVLVGNFLVNSWQGALLRMKVAKSPAPLDAFISVAFDHLLV